MSTYTVKSKYNFTTLNRFIVVYTLDEATDISHMYL